MLGHLNHALLFEVVGDQGSSIEFLQQSQLLMQPLAGFLANQRAFDVLSSACTSFQDLLIDESQFGSPGSSIDRHADRDLPQPTPERFGLAQLS